MYKHLFIIKNERYKLKVSKENLKYLF